MFPGVGGGVEMMGNRRERIVRAKAEESEDTIVLEAHPTKGKLAAQKEKSQEFFITEG